MELLQSFDFNARATDSRYDPIVSALVHEDAAAVRLSRGTDFGEETKVNGVASQLRLRIKKAGRRARVRIVDENTIVVGLWSEGEGPKRPARRRQRVAAGV